MSFRMTLNAGSYTDRGFSVNVNMAEQKVEIVFDATKVSDRHQDWLKTVREKVKQDTLAITPYWGFNDLYVKIGSKLTNCFFVVADTKKEHGKEYFHYNNVLMLKNVDLQKFVESIKDGLIYIDFDARTGHNHGTKFRIRHSNIPSLYQTATKII